MASRQTVLVLRSHRGDKTGWSGNVPSEDLPVGVFRCGDLGIEISRMQHRVHRREHPNQFYRASDEFVVSIAEESTS
jgi:hypothetical protein